MKLKRIVTMGIAALMAASAMSISAFAKEIVELDDGIIMTVYAPGEIVEEDLFQPQSVTISNHHLISVYHNIQATHG